MTTQADPKNDDDRGGRRQYDCHDEHQVDEQNVEVRSSRWRRRAVKTISVIGAAVTITKAITGAAALIDLIR